MYLIIIIIFIVATSSCKPHSVPINTSDATSKTDDITETTDPSTETLKESVTELPDTIQETKIEPAEEQTTQDELLEASSIAIFIYEGPLYSEEDNLCYYRIASEVYGNPYPKLTWSKDDSNGNFGKDKAQVNLQRGETYALSATATNLVNSITVTTDLSWGCDGEKVSQDISNGKPHILSTNIPVVYSETGTLIGIYDNFEFEYVGAGDFEANNYGQGFISFKINSIKDAYVKEASLIFPITTLYGDLYIFDKFYIRVFDWGEGLPIQLLPITSESQILLEKDPTSIRENMELVISDSILISEIQKAIDSDKSRFRLGIFFSGVTTDDDSQHDLIAAMPKDIALKLKYIKE